MGSFGTWVPVVCNGRVLVNKTALIHVVEGILLFLYPFDTIPTVCAELPFPSADMVKMVFTIVYNSGG